MDEERARKIAATKATYSTDLQPQVMKVGGGAVMVLPGVSETQSRVVIKQWQSIVDALRANDLTTEDFELWPDEVADLVYDVVRFVWHALSLNDNHTTAFLSMPVGWLRRMRESRMWQLRSLSGERVARGEGLVDLAMETAANLMRRGPARIQAKMAAAVLQGHITRHTFETDVEHRREMARIEQERAQAEADHERAKRAQEIVVQVEPDDPVFEVDDG